MGKERKESLEELTKKAEKSWGKQLPQFIPLTDFETKMRRIARRYGTDKIHQEGSHKSIEIGKKRIGWSPRRMGNEDVVSYGVFEETIRDISESLHIPLEQLKLYFKGGGKPYRPYKKKFEEEYYL